MLTPILNAAMRARILDHFRVEHLPEPIGSVPAGYALHSFLEDGYIAWGLPSTDAALGYAAALLMVNDAQNSRKLTEFSSIASRFAFEWGPDRNHKYCFITLARTREMSLPVPFFLDGAQATLLAKALRSKRDLDFIFQESPEGPALMITPEFDRRPQTIAHIPDFSVEAFKAATAAFEEEAEKRRVYLVPGQVDEQVFTPDEPCTGCVSSEPQRTGTNICLVRALQDGERQQICITLDDAELADVIELIEAGVRCHHG